MEMVQMSITGEWINNLCCNQVIEYYLTIKKNKINHYRLICKNIQNTVSEKKQTAEHNVEENPPLFKNCLCKAENTCPPLHVTDTQASGGHTQNYSGRWDCGHRPLFIWYISGC